MRDFEIGDTVRFAFMSYYEMAKSEYDQFCSIGPVSNAAQGLALGGIYTVLDKRKNPWGIREYKLLPREDTGSWALKAHVFDLEIASDCPYSVEDKVYFKPQSKPKDIEFIIKAFPKFELKPMGGPYIVEDIINQFYINVVTSTGVRNTFPFLWFDFTKWENEV